LERRIAELEAAAAPGTPAPAPAPARRAPRPRRPLRVPKGRFEDDPATLEAWLDRRSVHLLVDGYNVSKAEGGFGALELTEQRERVVDAVSRLARRFDVPATVVFDGSDVGPAPRRRPRSPVRVEYSRADETADDHLVALLERLPPDPVVVVTDDRELRARAATGGATVAATRQLLALAR
ncbi:MAG TPA: NYN domain-containing protein, partial [Actinomycetota bacterium]|nr:NYN domain-containing protein [Actinomycetota bacterium]